MRLGGGRRAGWTASRRRREGLTALIPLAAFLVAGAVAAGLVLDLGLPPAMAAHGALMLVAWAVLLPAGAAIARYGKVTRDQDFPALVDNPYWWHWHRALQYSGIALATGAFAAILSVTGGRFATVHGWLGLTVLALGWGQVLAGWLRGSKGGPTDALADPAHPETWRGDHYDMTLRRRVFERWHKTAGWGALALSALTILLGIELVGSPRWLLLLAGALQAAILCALLDGAIRKRWVDTYAALWGPEHPVAPATPDVTSNDGRARP